jgi:putative intracellular protease/amidase
MTFYPQDALALAGGAIANGDTPFQPNMIVDRELITGQNPASATEVAAEILKRVQ